ncbi:26S rRNA (cytosine-C(5))-methyltransferase nsun-1-like [Dreissena polymorpha]|uniref:26S rRNA (cytosine-C(5))-methyltransferase nsun-1-like n=1 Tax=Dreissena polymorpha TaxID=45954 RepID=UPI0022649141|nr:26S rRNA (cytosine-C(5))-methyltransferase nsun-1-like [Dreissena polymorpha]
MQTKAEGSVYVGFLDNVSPATSPDLAMVQQCIKDVMHVLGDFTARREPGRSRSEYMSTLLKDLCLYYSYNEYLMEKLISLFPSEIHAQCSVTHIQGATSEYLAGHYVLQGGSSFLPVMALAPQESERVLDMCSAPGGKTTYIAALMRNTGMLFANDANKERVQAVVGNVHRMGITNTVISDVDGRRLPEIMKGFDRVLLDAPCSGSGVISKDPEVKVTKDEADILRCSQLQKELLLAAIDCCNAKSKTGGYVVYSTCSVLR